jgi:hypothetical protein
MVASFLSGQTVTVYDLDLASRHTPRRHIFVWGIVLLCTVVSWLTQQVNRVRRPKCLHPKRLNVES